MFKFITHKPLWVNVLAAVALTFILIFSFLSLLDVITRHGKYLIVPDVRLKQTSDALKLLDKQGFDVVISDSVYTDSLPMGVVIKQNPDPNSTVKVNRTVYLMVNRETLPMIVMPQLEGMTFNFAMELMRRNHLVLADTVYKTSFMKGSVLEQHYKGSRLLAGTKIPWGSRITLYVGSGLGDGQILVPDLIGMKFGEAKVLLDSLGIIPVPVPDNTVTDTAMAFICRQRPEKLDEFNKPVYIKPGMMMDIFLSKQLPDSLTTKAH